MVRRNPIKKLCDASFCRHLPVLSVALFDGEQCRRSGGEAQEALGGKCVECDFHLCTRFIVLSLYFTSLYFYYALLQWYPYLYLHVNLNFRLNLFSRSISYPNYILHVYLSLIMLRYDFISILIVYLYYNVISDSLPIITFIVIPVSDYLQN